MVYVNGRSKNTVFISDTVLLLDNEEIEEGSSITVRQITGDFVELGSSDPFVYGNDQVGADAS